MLALIDTDPGLDDALALLLAWNSPELSLAAITTVAGNIGVEGGTRNLFRLMALRGIEPEYPIAQGAAAPLDRRPVLADDYHGQDGLGDAGDWPPVTPRLVPGTAAELIVESARRATAPLTLIPLGPLTNVALALERDADAIRRFVRVVVMGGAVDVPGNVTPGAEFNIYADPTAAARVLAADVPIDLVPLDATRQAMVSRADFERALARCPGPRSERIAAFTRRGFGPWGSTPTPVMVLHDPLAVALALDPTLADWESVHLEVGSDGETRRAAGRPNCRFARTVDTPRFLSLFLERLCPAS